MSGISPGDGQSAAALEATRAAQLAELQHLYDTSPVGLGFVDTQLRYVRLNERLAALNGRPAAEHLGRTLQEMVPDIAPQVEPLYRQVIETGKPVIETEVHGTTPAAPGFVRDFLVGYYPVRAADGSVAGVGITVHEITELTHAQESVRASEARNAAILETALDAIVTMDHEGRIVEFNPAAERMFGYRREAVLGQPLAELIIPASLREQHHGGLTRYLTTGAASVLGRRLELVALRADGAEFPVELAITRIPIEGPPVFTGHIRDITERKRTEGALRESEERFRSLCVHAPVGIFLTDAQGDCLFVNDCWCRMAGMSPTEARGQGWVRALHPEDRERVFREWYEAAKARREFSCEYRFQTPAGQVTWLRGSAVALRSPSGEVTQYLGTVTDITEAKRAEKRLACEHAIARALAEVATLADAAPRVLEMVGEYLGAAAGNLWEVDADQGVLRCTAVWARSPSRGVEIFQAASWSKTFAPGVGLPGRVWKERQIATITGLSEDPNFPRLQLAEAAGLASGMAFPLSTGDDLFGVMEFFTERALEPDREFLPMMTAIGHDIGQFIRRRRAEQALAAEQERLLVTLSSIGDAVIVTDAQGRSSFLNPMAEKLTGWSQEAASGRGLEAIFRIIHEESRAAVESPVTRVLREGRVVGLANHTVLITREGAERPIDDSAAPICDEAGNIIGVVLVFRDVTQRRQAERALRASEERFRLMADRAPVMIWISDTTGSCTWFNRPWLEFTGRPLEQDLGHGWTQVVHPADLEECLQIYVSAFEVRQPFNMEYRLRRHDGEYRWVLDYGTPLHDGDGVFTGYIGSCLDITEHKRLEAELRERAEELVAADRRKDEFLAMLAHELRNPLAPIRNAVQILRYRSGDVPSVERVREMIERQVQHLARLVDDLLDVSRITRGKISLQQERLDLARLTRVNGEDHRSAFEAVGVALRIELPDGPVWVIGDATRLTQVLDNLLENARKFSDQSGQVVVRLWEDAATREAVLSVRDTGIGIEPETIPRLFEVFAQADRSLDRSRGGLGLGLPLIKGLVELHGGRVDVQSKGIGQGAEFTLRLPLVEELPALSPSEVTIPRSQRRLRILVVEDSRDAAESLRVLLELFGYEVTVAHSGTAGVEVANCERPDVVVCDLGLPGMDGFAVASALRRNPRTAAARLIAVTGYGQEEDRQRAREAGFDDHLTKPVDPDTLLTRLDPETNAGEH